MTSHEFSPFSTNLDLKINCAQHLGEQSQKKIVNVFENVNFSYKGGATIFIMLKFVVLNFFFPLNFKMPAG
ncbi:hypothetical protein TNIN_202091 [Trichonephila inaurata madagascariensis]|uniref:Uncharacterized protein n=1 Tax=Trichonephila inaurata madagascariensis TaxID=2747483 RepID=A0A8X6Y0I7_9ARAC|nr:hypothetical protein TNIN_202091 [Trichonephila inaurata madagascariensis]